MLYEETDKMKFLRTQQHYADVIVDRRQQIIVKQEARQKEKEFDAVYHQLTMQQIRESQDKEYEALRKQEEQSKMVAASRAQQFDEVLQRRAHEEEEQRKLGLSMKEAAETRVREDLIAREKKAIEIRAGRMKTLEKNAELREDKKRLQREEEAAEREREREIAIIEERKKAREDLEKLRFEQAQVNRQKIIDKAVELLAKKVNNEDAIMAKQQKEFNDKIKVLLSVCNLMLIPPLHPATSVDCSSSFHTMFNCPSIPPQ